MKKMIAKSMAALFWEQLWRDVTAIPSGTEFDIHFQIIDAETLTVVLTSGCYQYTVR